MIKKYKNPKILQMITIKKMKKTLKKTNQEDLKKMKLKILKKIKNQISNLEMILRIFKIRVNIKKKRVFSVIKIIR